VLFGCLFTQTHGARAFATLQLLPENDSGKPGASAPPVPGVSAPRTARTTAVQNIPKRPTPFRETLC
jgi:hypothetical protein